MIHIDIHQISPEGDITHIESGEIHGRIALDVFLVMFRRGDDIWDASVHLVEKDRITLSFHGYIPPMGLTVLAKSAPSSVTNRYMYTFTCNEDARTDRVTRRIFSHIRVRALSSARRNPRPMHDSIREQLYGPDGR